MKYDDKIRIQKIRVENINYIYYNEKRGCTVIVMEDENTYDFSYSCKKLLELLCIKYGSTLKGRIDFFSEALSVYKKIPLLISERHEIILFPLYGYRNEKSLWISLAQIKRVENKENLTTDICFRNNTRIQVEINYRSIYKQIRRSKKMIKLLNDL